MTDNLERKMEQQNTTLGSSSLAQASYESTHNKPESLELSTDFAIPLRAERFRFVVKLDSPLYISQYAGSMLRGAFGHALRRVACMSGQSDCKGCGLYRGCLYTRIFETPPPEQHQLQKFSQIPNPYIIEPPEPGTRDYKAGEEFEFHMVLVGEAIEQLALILFAWQRALKFGLSKLNARGRLLSVWHCDENPTCIWEEEQTQLQSFPTKEVWPSQQASSVELTLLTPMRLQKQGQLIGPQQLTARDLLINLARRIGLLAEFHHQPLNLDYRKLAETAEQIRLQSSLTWFDWQRYSHRQQRAMKLGGVVGRLSLTGELASWMPFLTLGERCHLGKNATFGLGHYRITRINR
jgi:hypothetical protein